MRCVAVINLSREARDWASADLCYRMALGPLNLAAAGQHDGVVERPGVDAIQAVAYQIGARKQAWLTDI